MKISYWTLEHHAESRKHRNVETQRIYRHFHEGSPCVAESAVCKGSSLVTRGHRNMGRKHACPPGLESFAARNAGWSKRFCIVAATVRHSRRPQPRSEALPEFFSRLFALRTGRYKSDARTAIRQKAPSRHPRLRTRPWQLCC